MVFDIDDATDVNVCLGDEKITTCLKNGSQACTLVNVVAADLVFFVFHRFLATHKHTHTNTLVLFLVLFSNRSLLLVFSLARQSYSMCVCNGRRHCSYIRYMLRMCL